MISNVLSKAELWTLSTLGIFWGNFWKSKTLIENRRFENVPFLGRILILIIPVGLPIALFSIAGFRTFYSNSTNGEK